MSTSIFRELLSLGRPLFLDGAMGTMLQAKGMPAGVSPEKFCLSRPEVLMGVHKDYIDAGADLLLSSTFGGSPFKLDPSLDVFEFNKRMVEIAKAAAEGAGRPVCIGGDMGPSGHFAKPLGDVEPEELIEGFARQAAGLAAGGCDFIAIETQFDIAEARAAVVGARRACNLPILVSMTFEQGTSLTGSNPTVFCETMQNLGVDVVGTNCSFGPDLMLPIAREMLSCSNVAVMAEPNAGLPELRDGKTVFPLGPEAFAREAAPFVAMGVRIIGGCCGTTPAHIKALRQAVEALEIDESQIVRPTQHKGIALTSRQQVVRIGAGEPFVLIGERINPTGKKQLTKELQEGSFATVLSFAEEQIAAGARVLDVNAGAHMVDQESMLPKLAALLTGKHPVPLSLDSSDANAIIKALPWYPASPLVNSVNGEEGRMRLLGSACRDYGAPFILLPIKGTKLPVKATERIRILESLMAEAEELGIPKRLMIVDILALSVSSKSEGALQCLSMIDWCKERGLATTLGLSNLSFGLPARDLINASFLCMGAGAGLSSCIANPSAPRVSEAFSAIRLLTDNDPHAESFISRFSDWKAGQASGPAAGQAKKAGSKDAYEAVVQGDRENIEALLDEELSKGAEPFEIVNAKLIPAITEVGKLYERKVYFLPQLIRSAETMQAGFAKLKPLLKSDSDTERPTIVMATVEGDIHDIGKNIVCLLLGNHGFRVVDAGKDVGAAEIVAKAEECNAKIIGLSALMTTTMVKMEETVKLVREKGLPVKIMVGGAAVTKAFADSIGADAYCLDAVEAVDAAKRLIS